MVVLILSCFDTYCLTFLIAYLTIIKSFLLIIIMEKYSRKKWTAEFHKALNRVVLCAVGWQMYNSFTYLSFKNSLIGSPVKIPWYFSTGQMFRQFFPPSIHHKGKTLISSQKSLNIVRLNEMCTVKTSGQENIRSSHGLVNTYYTVWYNGIR